MKYNLKICVLLVGLLTSSLHANPIIDASKRVYYLVSEENNVDIFKIIALAYVLVGATCMGGLLLFKYLMDRHLEAIVGGIAPMPTNRQNITREE